MPIAAWETTAVTLLGDAIHVMSSSIGAGADIALRDARILASRLAGVVSGQPLSAALHAYEGEMVGYGFDAASGGPRLVAFFGELSGGVC